MHFVVRIVVSMRLYLTKLGGIWPLAYHNFGCLPEDLSVMDDRL